MRGPENESSGSVGLRQVPDWAWQVLAAPGGGPLRCESGLLWVADRPIGRIVDGVLRFDMPGGDPSTEYYRAIGGAHFHERSAVSYAMTALDTPVYHDYLHELMPDDRNSLIIDLGGGDGRNALPWLRSGFKRVIVVDSNGEALARFGARVSAENPKWLDHLLLVECDARNLPLISEAADRVLAIEALYYLLDDYEQGLRQCHRVMRSQARLLLADRSYEGALLTQLLYYGGLDAMLETACRREMSDGEDGHRVRTRFFLYEELRDLVAAQGFEITDSGGISAFALLLSFLSKLDRLKHATEEQLAAMHQLLVRLGRTGWFRRCHVIIAEKRVATI
jgi:ubiquinone/menaquinone biosynthesis C-methylase UbiE